MKSHSGAKTRFKLTGNGKVMRRQQNKGHNLGKKSVSRKARLSKEVRISRGEARIVRSILGMKVRND